jgi:GNAT superfamily N-acetyltransferase
MAEIIIRKYEDRDRDALLKCIDGLQDHEAECDPIKLIVNKEGFDTVYVEVLMQRMNDEDGMIFVAESDGAVVGIVACIIKHYERREVLGRSSSNPYGYVVDLFVLPEARNNEVGAKLMAAAEEYFRSKGCDFSTVGVLAPNTRAHAFYNKIGYADRYIDFIKKL